MKRIKFTESFKIVDPYTKEILGFGGVILGDKSVDQENKFNKIVGSLQLIDLNQKIK